jgi:NAD(P)-dependent dehydrogenase (short-subunit alcohol dehydrogenase family)
MNALKFGGRVALVTGAGRGLGRSHAVMLASRGCRVIVNDVGAKTTGTQSDENPAADVVREIEALGGIAVADRHDVVTAAGEIVRTALSHFGQLDIVVNNAGTLNGTTLADTPPEIWHAVADVHFRGTVEVCRAAWPSLVKSGSGRIVNTSSTAMLGNSHLTSYGSAKAAVFGFSRSLALEGVEFGINVNCILPSAWTRMTEKIDDPRILSTLKKYFQPEHVSSLVTWLVHPDTRVTNQSFQVSGGRAARLVIAAAPFVEVPASTPEGWAQQESALLKDGHLTPLLSTGASFRRELVSADPTLKSLLGEGDSIAHTPTD